jgi:hypothetical protein
MLFMMTFIAKNIYSQGRAQISDFLRRLLHVFLHPEPAITLTIFFCKLNILLLLDELLQKIFEPNTRSYKKPLLSTTVVIVCWLAGLSHTLCELC